MELSGKRVMENSEYVFDLQRSKKNENQSNGLLVSNGCAESRESDLELNSKEIETIDLLFEEVINKTYEENEEKETTAKVDEVIKDSLEKRVDIVDSSEGNLTENVEKMAIKVLRLIVQRKQIKVEAFKKCYSTIYGEELSPKSLNCETFFEFFNSLTDRLPISLESGVLVIDDLRLEEWIWDDCFWNGNASMVREVFNFKWNVALPPDSVSEIGQQLILVNENAAEDNSRTRSMDVQILAIGNAGKIFVQLKSFEMTCNNLTFAIQNHFSNKGEENYLVPPALAGIGLYCVVLQDQFCYRGKITRVWDAVTVSVYLIDFGWSVKTNIKHLRLLPREFLTLPQLVICVSLRGIAPINRETNKYKDTAKSLLQFTGDQYWLKCYFFPKTAAKRYSVILIDKNGGKNISLGQFLIEKKLAIAADYV